MSTSQSSIVAQNGPPYFHVLAKPTGAVCNLDCKYCFFLSKEMLYPGSRFRMADELLETYIGQTIEGQNSPEITIAWQGGEPTLMGLDFFRRSIALEQKYLKPGQTIQNTLQTNGVKLDDEWCKFFREHNFLIGLSLDGTREMNDAYRVDKSGAGTFDRVVAAARLMQKHNVEFNVLTTVHAANADHPLELYRFLRDDLGTKFIQFIPIVERTTPELINIANRGWGEQLRDRPLLGNIAQTPLVQLVGLDKQVKFGNDKRDTLPSYCRECDVRFACHGECPKNRFIQTPDGEPGMNYLCAGYMAFFEHIDRPMKLMAQLLRSGRYADEAMAILEAERAERIMRTGRNDACPCGSGRKFKKCHAESREATATAGTPQIATRAAHVETRQ